MSNSADRETLRGLVEDLPDESVATAIAELRQLSHPALARPWPPAWFGSVASERTDLAANHDDLLAEGFGQSA